MSVFITLRLVPIALLLFAASQPALAGGGCGPGWGCWPYWWQARPYGFSFPPVAPLPPPMPAGFGQFPTPVPGFGLPGQAAPTSTLPGAAAAAQTAQQAPLSATDEQLLQLLRLLLERRDPTISLLLEQRLQTAPSVAPASPTATAPPTVTLPPPQPSSPPAGALGNGLRMRQELGPNSVGQELSTGR